MHFCVNKKLEKKLLGAHFLYLKVITGDFCFLISLFQTFIADEVEWFGIVTVGCGCNTIDHSSDNLTPPRYAQLRVSGDTCGAPLAPMRLRITVRRG